MQTGKYKVKSKTNVAMNRCAFTVPAGTEIRVSQVDKERRKVLIHFGRDAGWFHESWLERNASAI